SLGEPTQDVSPLLGFELQKAGDFGAIARRYQPGAFGLGHADSTQNFVETFADNSVVLHLAGGQRRFALGSTGVFHSLQPGDTGTLTLASGIYKLTEIDGSFTQFLAN